MKKGAFTKVWFLAASVFLMFYASAAYSAVLYVKPPPSGNDVNTGFSWEKAKATISGAIAAATKEDEIWVAAGTYPERIGNKVADAAAVDVTLYGGFVGNETIRSQRNWKNNPTLLDGAYGGTVVSISDGAGQQTRIDGFRITRGTVGIDISNSAPVIANNLIYGNKGPGIHIYKYKVIAFEPSPVVAHPTINNNQIVDNQATNGAGIAVEGDLLTSLVPAPATAPVISNNTIARNEAFQNGGGIGCWGHTAPLIKNNYILANSAATFEIGWDSDDPVGPWIVGGGGIFASKCDMSGRPLQYAVSAPTIINNVVSANGALLGGGICLVIYPRLSESNNPPAVVANNTVVANNGSGIYWGETFPTVRNNLVAFNTWGLQQDRNSDPVVEFNNVFGNQVQGDGTDYFGMSDQTGLNGNISADPVMANYTKGEFHLQPGSPCRDAGASEAVGAGWKDIDGQDRVMGEGVDIGADESNGDSWPTAMPVVYVSKAGKDEWNGLSWATAKKTLTAGIEKAATTGGEVWTAKGVFAEHIIIKPFVYLYGGFAGTETSRNNRNITANPTILDGGGIPTVVLSKNAGYLVSALDGFTIENGGIYRGNVVPEWNWGYEGRGGAIRSKVTGLYIANNTIRRNSLGNPFQNADKRAHGGGIHGYISHSVVSGNTIAENEVLNTFDGTGGGIYFKMSMPLIEKNTLSGNHARYGSAIHCLLSIPKIIGNTIEKNDMYNSYPLPLYFGAVDGAVTIDMGENFLIERNVIRGNTAGTGAGINVKTNSAGRIQNNLILNNTAYDPTALGGMGGGIYCLIPTTATDNHYIVNNTIVGNSASWSALLPPMNEQGGGIALSLPVPLPLPEVIPPAKLIIGNNIIAFNSSGFFQTTTIPMISFTLRKNDVFNSGINYRDVIPGVGDIAADPLFLNRPGGDFHLAFNSPCMDSGDNTLAHLLAFDFDGNPRIVDAGMTGTAIVDMGAYEQGDTDQDGLPDILEDSGCTDAADADTDDDGIADGVEDANGNGAVDGGETNPCNPDTDGDGIQDGTELGFTLADIGPDTNTGIFVPDADPKTITDPLNKDSDNDGRKDGKEDKNLNGKVDPGETDPNQFERRITLPFLQLLMEE
jgi:hypothetical protein